MSTYLVTGGCGFLGSHLVQHLVKMGHQVRILDQHPSSLCQFEDSQIHYIEGDVCNPDIVKSSLTDVDGCFHLAAIRNGSTKKHTKLSSHQINLIGSLNLFEQAGKLKTPVVYASSSQVYGDNADWSLSEQSRVSPLSDFGADKLGIELHAKISSLTYGNKITGLRFFNVYGPHLLLSKFQQYGVVSTIVNRLQKNKPAVIYGDGDQIRDFVYIDDAIHFLQAAMDEKSIDHSIYNVCSGESVSINQLARSIMSILNIHLPIVHEPSRRHDIRGFIGDPTKATKMLGVSAKTKIADGLYKTINEDKILTDGQFIAMNETQASSQACFLR